MSSATGEVVNSHEPLMSLRNRSDVGADVYFYPNCLRSGVNAEHTDLHLPPHVGWEGVAANWTDLRRHFSVTHNGIYLLGPFLRVVPQSPITLQCMIVEDNSVT